MTKREQILARAILEELANMPQDYRQPQSALIASVRLSVSPPPTDDELDNVLARLEADCYITCAATMLSGKGWSITARGRQAYEAS